MRSPIEQLLIDGKLYWDKIGPDWSRLIERRDFNVIGNYRKLREDAWEATLRVTRTTREFSSEDKARFWLEAQFLERTVKNPETVTLELTPDLLCMAVIARTKDAVYLRLPPALQRDCGGCSCEQCKGNPAISKWDTLVVPIASEGRSYHVHMPDGSVAAFKAYVRRTEKEG